MAYKTYHTFSPLTEHTELQYQIIADLRQSNHDAFLAFNKYGLPDTDCTWNNHEADLKEFSKKYPDIVLELFGEGEESGDEWYQYFKNGKSQYCPAVMTYEPYDENKLT